jgi:hypothetical protein
MPKPTTKKAKRQAKKLFPRQPHTTRVFFTITDYNALPKGEKQ